MPAYDYNSIGIGVRAVQNMFKQKEAAPKQPKEPQIEPEIIEPQEPQGGFDKLMAQPTIQELPVERPEVDLDNFDLIGEDQAENFPEDSDVGKILRRGNSLIIDTKTNGITGVRTRSGGALSMQEALKGVDPEDILIKNGFHDIPENVQKFIAQNPDLSVEPRKLDFTGLKAASNPEVVKDKLSEVTWGLLMAPLNGVMAAGGNVLGFLSEGLQRYEALKASVLDPTTILSPVKRMKEIGGSLFGATPTEFPDAKLRTGEYKELGDIYRKMGFPEWFAATVGFGLDVASDFGIGALAPKAVKAASKIKVGEKTVGDVTQPFAEAAREQFLKFRSNEFVKEVEGALTGKSRFDIASAPGLKPVMRGVMGETNYQAQMAVDHSHQIKNFINTKVAAEAPELQMKVGKEWQNLFHEAITGNQTAFAKLPVEGQAWVRGSRGVVDNLSGELVPHLRRIIENPSEKIANREARKRMVAAKFGIRGGEELPIDDLIKRITENQGSYLKRNYRMFQKDYVPEVDAVPNAVAGLMREFPKDYATKELAEAEVNRILKDKSVFLKDVKGDKFQINTGSFIARQNIPPYLRELMGEIKDPAYNIVETTRSLAETVQNLKFFEALKSMGAVIPEGVAKEGFDNIISTKGTSPLHWASIEGMRTTPEVHALLKGLQAQEDTLTETFMKASTGIKFAKTVLNPKSHAHNMTGNALVFSTLAGISPFDPSNAKFFKESAQLMNDMKLMQAGKLPLDHPNVLKFREMVKQGVVGTELPVADNITFVENLLKNPFGLKQDNVVVKGAKDFARKAAELYAQEDQLFKMASYLKYTKQGMSPEKAVTEVYKWFPNYAEASMLAEHARSSPIGVLFMSPFLTFRSEAHRIMLNAFKESPQHRAMMGGLMASRFAWNTAMLSMAGNGLADVREFYMTDPNSVADKFVNPLSKEFDLNVKYIDPFNTAGLFAPLMAYAGATGVSPFDYLLDFTNFSPEFGYSNLYVNAIEGGITGRGRFGETLTAQERLAASIKGVVGSSWGSDLPKILDNNEEPTERARRVLRFAGVDVEKRDASWIRPKAAARLSQRLQEGVNVEPTLRAIEELGFDSQDMLKKVVKKQKSVFKKAPESKKESNIDRALSILEQENRK